VKVGEVVVMRTQRAWIVAGSAALGLALAIPARAQGNGAWLHVRVEEPQRQSKVAVNLPLSVVEVALQAAPDTLMSHGHLKLGHEGHGLEIADLRKMWNELKAAGDAELVNVEEKDQKVRIARAGELVVIHVDKTEGPESVRIEVPADVVDALLSGEGNELNVKAALTRLQKRRGDIVKVSEKDQSVRIWIDEGK
jgi:hypothetical protein